MKVEFATEAGRDVDDILAETLRRFGGRQVDVYSGYLKRAVELLADNHLRASSRPRPDVRSGARSLHLEIAARGRGRAAHVLYYREMTDSAGDPVVVVVRVLHERMDPARHISASTDDTPTA